MLKKVPVGTPRSSAEKGRAATKLLRHPKLLPYSSTIAPLLPRLAPHAVKIIDSLETLGPHVPALIAALPKLLPHLGKLLDELPHLAPYLDAIVPQLDPLLANIDKITPHFAPLRPHLPALAPALPHLAPHLGRITPFIATLSPHLDTLLKPETFTHLIPVLEELTRDEPLRLLLPHVRAFSMNVPRLAPHLPALLQRLDTPDDPLGPCLPAIFANLPTLLQSNNLEKLLTHFESVLAGLQREGEDDPAANTQQRFSVLLGNPEALSDELKAKERDASQHEGDWWGAVVGFFTGDGKDEAERAEAAKKAEAEMAEARKRAESAADAQRSEDLTKLFAAIDGAARRMAAVEERFLETKRTHVLHTAQEQDTALKCAKLEETLMKVDDAIVSLQTKSNLLADALDVAEAEVGNDEMMKARELRQIETINGGKSLDAVPPPSERAAALVAMKWDHSPVNPEAYVKPPPKPGKQKSLMSTIEENLLSKVVI